MKGLTWQDRFWNKVELVPFHSCWEWTGFKRKDGYGGFSHVIKKLPNNKYKLHQWLAHRASLSLSGVPLIEGLVVDHVCRNRGCVNPAHLRQVTIAQNTLENSASLSAKNKIKTTCPKGHPYSGVKKIYSGWGVVARICHRCDAQRAREHRARKRVS